MVGVLLSAVSLRLLSGPGTSCVLSRLGDTAGRPPPFLLALLLVFGAIGCGDDGDRSTCAALLPGELVITEIMSDPTGPDEGGEWFEIYNATDAPILLDGLTVVHSRGDGSMRRQMTLGAVTIAAGDYLVMGNVLAELKQPWVDIGYANQLGDLYNTGSGRLAIQCGTAEVDAVTYANGRSGRSRQLDGERPPDYTVNDDLTQWCVSSQTLATEYTAGNYGTPGTPNEDCEIITAGMCDDGESLRPTLAPEPGDLVITEVMPNPAAVADNLGEWFEVYVTRDVDLNGVTLDRAGDSSAGTELQAERCMRVTAGTFAVFARSSDAGINGGLPHVEGTFSFTLVTGSTSSPGDIAIKVGDTTIDAVTWVKSGAGKSLQVDPDFANATDNDVFANFCDGTQVYGEGDLGTPGAPNAQCPEVAPPGTCIDGAQTRALVVPEVGDLVIAEVMPSPNAVSDTTGEWFEVVATRAVDLNGIGLDRVSDSANPNVISSATCLHLAAGERALFARSTDPANNGGLPPVTASFTFSLITGSSTTPGDVRIVRDALLLDAVTWTRSTAGASLQLDPDFANPVDNDLQTSWCDATTAYGAGDLGTPRAVNIECAGGPAPGTCLESGSARALVSPVPGDLVITEVMPNPSAVSDSVGEWFEVLVTRDVDLNGVGLDRAGDTASAVVIASADCMRASAGTHLVFARSADPAINGRLLDVTHTFNFSLVSGSTSSPGDVRLVLGSTTLDSVLWTSSTGGTSRQLDPGFSTPMDNDDDTYWCAATTAYGDGDFGTPGSPNAVCVAAPIAGTCTDGSASRPISKPAPGDLVITELMPNPEVEPGQEWFEITNVGATPFDLNDLGLDRANDTRAPDLISSVTCMSLAPGGFALFARSASADTNGGLPPPDATFGFSMVNSTGEVRVLDGTLVLDAVTWTTSTNGVSSQLDPDLFSTSANDSSASFCNSTAPYGDGTNKGTPRSANAQCP